ncbi:MAG: Sir2 family NAD+-dependent deacetylase, partial [Pseudomonadota bacterium]
MVAVAVRRRQQPVRRDLQRQRAHQRLRQPLLRAGAEAQRVWRRDAALQLRPVKPPPQCRRVVVLTGAGISAESGLKTFRDNDGLWEGHRVEDVATPEAFARDPETVQRFYNQRRAQLVTEAIPNAAHAALARFEQRFDGEFTLVTQNVDDLHERAGSRAVIHMHGELLKVRCERCAAVQSWREPLETSTRCPACGSVGAMRPHIVWFGEMPFQMATIESALMECDLFVSIGTSGHVYPAAGFVDLANRVGATTVELILEASLGASLFDHCVQGPAGTVVPAFF